MEPKTLREQLEDNWEGEEVDDEQLDEAPESEPDTDPGSEAESLPEQPEPEESTIGSEPDGGSERNDQEPVADSEDPEPVVATPSNKAPASWRPAVREEWDKLPEAVRNEVAKRERDFQVQIQGNSEAVNEANEFRQATAPFQQFFAAEGVTAAQATQNLMQTAAGLRVGTPQQKTQIVSSIIKQFGIDIGMLDTMLSGQQVADTGEDTHLQGMLQQELAPIRQFMGEQVQQRQNQQVQYQQNAGNELNTFAQSHEYFEDLRYIMADILDVAQRNNTPMDLETAYAHAATLNPEISGVMQQRAAAQLAPDLAKKRRAASTVAGSPGAGAGGAPAPQDLRATINAAWNGDID